MNKTFHISNKKPNPSPIFLKSSHHVTKKVIKPTLDSSKDTEIHLNPNLIKHFMSKNDFYYDIKTWKARRGKVDKESKYSFTGRCGFIPKQKFLDIISLGKYVNSNDQRIVDKEFEIFSCNFIKDDIILNGNARNSNYNQLLKQYMKDQSHSKPNKSTTNNIYRLFKPGEIPNYINEFRARESIERQFEKLKAIEKNYPSGAFHLSNEDIVHNIQSLENIKEYILFQLNDLPISVEYRSLKCKNKKKFLEDSLNDLQIILNILKESNHVFILDNK